MTQKQNIRILLILGLVFGSLGGWLLHLRIHPPAKVAINLLPFIAGMVNIIIIPALFFSAAATPYVYVVNGMLVIIGAITMAHVSLWHLPPSVTLQTIFVGTLLADIFLLFTNFFFGKALFELELFKAIDAQVRKGRFFRYPNMGYWGVHAIALTAVYAAGHLLWR
ncbi:MAG: hypothetical protein PHC61_02640 [Chitinivibrionales bacterium]|nr:hypothetical protein [Chitinivibrionales bacterium]